MPNTQTKTTTEIKVPVLISTSLILVSSAISLFISWGMMAMAAVWQIQERKMFHIAVNVDSPEIEKLWEYFTIDAINTSSGPTIADIIVDSDGLEIASDVQDNNGEIGTALLLTSNGKNLENQYEAHITLEPIPIDWNSDGINELVFFEVNLDNRDNFIVVTSGVGQTLTRIPLNEFFTTTSGLPAIVDLNQDGFKDFVMTYQDIVINQTYNDIIHAINGKDGSTLWKYEIPYYNVLLSGQSSPPITPDLDQDNHYDILFLSYSCLTQDDLVDGRVAHDGGLLSLYEIDNSEFEIGIRGVLVKNNIYLCGTAAFRLNDVGTLVWRTFLNTKKNEFLSYAYQLAAADFNGDNILEIVAAPVIKEGNFFAGSNLALMDSLGSILWNKQEDHWSTVIQGVGNMIKSEGTYDAPEIVTTYRLSDMVVFHVGIYNYEGDLVSDIKISGAEIYGLYNRTLADFDGDNLLEVIISDIPDFNWGKTKLVIYNGDTSEFVSWEEGLWSYGSVQVADINGDGRIEAVPRMSDLGIGREYSKIVALSFPLSQESKYAMPWFMPRHDAHRTAWYDYDDPSAFPVSPKNEVPFRRGDADTNGTIDLTDGIFILNYLFKGEAKPLCFDAADVDDNGVIDITDSIFLLNYMFKGGATPPAPGPETLGVDPTIDDLICNNYLPQ